MKTKINQAIKNRAGLRRGKSFQKKIAAMRHASTLRWITYDGTPETLPGVGETALFDAGEDGAIVVFYRLSPQGRTWCHYEPGSGDFEVEVGDRWASLPTPSSAD